MTRREQYDWNRHSPVRGCRWSRTCRQRNSEDECRLEVCKCVCVRACVCVCVCVCVRTRVSEYVDPYARFQRCIIELLQRCCSDVADKLRRCCSLEYWWPRVALHCVALRDVALCLKSYQIRCSQTACEQVSKTILNTVVESKGRGVREWSLCN
jgi:hypothetical protein